MTNQVENGLNFGPKVKLDTGNCFNKHTARWLHILPLKIEISKKKLYFWLLEISNFFQISFIWPFFTIFEETKQLWAIFRFCTWNAVLVVVKSYFMISLLNYFSSLKKIKMLFPTWLNTCILYVSVIKIFLKKIIIVFFMIHAHI